jgi:MFS family permease
VSRAPEPPKRPSLITPAFVLIGLATLAYFVAENIVLPILPLYVRGPLGGGDVAVGVVVGAFSVTALLVRPWAGRLADRRGRRLPMVLGVSIFTASVSGYTLSGSVAVLVALRLLTGVGEALFFTAAASAIADMAPDERRGEAISFFSLALWTGIAVGPVVGEVVLHGGRFSLVWLVSTAFGLLAGILALRIRVPGLAGKEGHARLIHRAALLPGGTLLTSILGAAGFFAFVPLYSRQLGLSGARLVFVVFSGLVVAIRLFGARLPDRLGPVRTTRMSLAVSALGLVVMGSWRTTAGLFAATSLYGVGQALAFPALMTLALRDVPAGERGAVVATFTSFVDLGFGIGPAALGFVADASGYPAVFLAGAAAAGLGLLAFASRYRVGSGVR